MSYFEESRIREDEERAAKKEAEMLAAQFRIDLKKVLSSPEGVRILYHIIDFSGVWTSVMKTSSEIYYRAGAASVGHELLEKIQKIAPDSYLEIMKLKFEKEK
jgi:hypothetical protein